MKSEERVCLRGFGDKWGIPKESLMIVGLVDKRERKNYKTRTRVPKIEQPYGTNTGQIRQMAPGRSMGLMGTGFQILASKGSGAAEDTDSSAYSVQVNVLNLGRRGGKLEFFVIGRGSQTKAHWNIREEQPLISDQSVCRAGLSTQQLSLLTLLQGKTGLAATSCPAGRGATQMFREEGQLVGCTGGRVMSLTS